VAEVAIEDWGYLGGQKKTTCFRKMEIAGNICSP